MKHLYYIILASILTFTVAACVDDEPVAENRYANTSEMVSTFLTNRSEQYSEFITVLQRAGLWELMGTYGEYTCFAPTNDAIKTFLSSRGLNSLDQLSKEDCDTLARTHIITATYFITDMGLQEFGKHNMLDFPLTLSCDSNNVSRLVYVVNANSRMIQYDDSVQNGVVHTMDRVIVNNKKVVFEQLRGDSTCQLFYQALMLTHLGDSLNKTEDETYTISPDSSNVKLGSKHHRTFGNNDVYWRYPESRKLQ